MKISSGYPFGKGLGGLPLVTLCCLGLLGLIFAGTIVVALIPVYLQRRGINSHQQESGIIQILYNLPVYDGLLIVSVQVPQSRYEMLQNILQQQLDNATGGSRGQQIQVKVVSVAIRQAQNMGEKVSEYYGSHNEPLKQFCPKRFGTEPRYVTGK
ncbi:unnamed protein product [Didymodactylos carnosus]|uniref:Uncharacterized protein n=1 Tax=Didymodactylos carnosus TaxID=1234261 RepID=A0A8S2EFD1_9BILA|nr:unnamed protein product [Didymodactylos carnosus]CAF3979444.1 unnamed protein product [Didymodactylos carnosus]